MPCMSLLRIFHRTFSLLFRRIRPLHTPPLDLTEIHLPRDLS